VPDVDDPRLAQFPMHMRQMLIAQLSAQVREPDVMVTEPCAISTRVAPSFLRVGHVDLFSRRAAEPSASELAKRQHVAMVEHMLFREYPDVLPGAPLQERALAAIDAAADRIAAMVAGWIRIGFCQGNFNADNCLAGGRTMDYGPFGWMDKCVYLPLSVLFLLNGILGGLNFRVRACCMHSSSCCHPWASPLPNHPLSQACVQIRCASTCCELPVTEHFDMHQIRPIHRSIHTHPRCSHNPSTHPPTHSLTHPPTLASPASLSKGTTQSLPSGPEVAITLRS
jgi:hypothetical protein